MINRLQELECEGRDKLTLVRSASSELVQVELTSLLQRFEQNITKFDASTAEKLRSRLYLMIGLHWDQEPRSGGEPYIIHPLRVGLRLMEEFHTIDSDLIEIAFLHDALEDQLDKILFRTDIDTISRVQQLLQEGRVQQVLLEGFDEMAKWIGSENALGVAILSSPYWQTSILPGLLTKEMSNTEADIGSETNTERDFDDKGIAVMMSAYPRIALVKFSDLMDNAFRVSSVVSIPRRQKLSRKYLPVLRSIEKNLPGYSQSSALPDGFKEKVSSCILQLESFL